MTRRKKSFSKKVCRTNHSKRIPLGNGKMKCTECGEVIINLGLGVFGWPVTKGLPDAVKKRTKGKAKISV
jgi:hypothetical protein